MEISQILVKEAAQPGQTSQKWPPGFDSRGFFRLSVKEENCKSVMETFTPDVQCHMTSSLTMESRALMDRGRDRFFPDK